MAPGTLAPAYFELNYHSAFGNHKAQIGTKEWFPTNITGNLGSYESWLAGPVDAEEMIQTYADNMMAFYPDTAGTDFATIWTKASPTAPALPQRSFPIVSPGTSISTNWSKAVQFQWIIRGDDFSLMKLYFLDPIIGGSWDALSDLSGSAPSQAVVDHVIDDNQAFMTRKDGNPTSFVKVTYKLNDKLRHEYGMD